MAWNSKSEDIGIKVNGTPAIASRREGCLDVFVRSLDNRLFHRRYENEIWKGPAWTDISAGRLFEAAPAAVSWGPDKIDLFAVWNKQVQHLYYQSGVWSSWAENVGGVTLDTPAAASYKAGRVDVLVRTADNFMSRRFWEGSWKDWENIGGQHMTLTSAPAAVATGPNRIDCFARGPNDGHLIHAWYQDGQRQEWTELDNLTIRSAPAVTSAATADRGRVDVFIRGTDDILRHRVLFVSQTGASWEQGSTWKDVNMTQVLSAPAAVAWWSGNALRRIDIFAQGANNSLVHTRWA